MRYSIILIVTVFLLSACSSGVPNCSDQEVKDLVIEIAVDNNKGETGLVLALRGISITEYSVGSIRTTYTDDNTGAHECAAELHYKAENKALKTAKELSTSITYTVEVTDDGESFFVNVFGL